MVRFCSGAGRGGEAELSHPAEFLSLSTNERDDVFVEFSPFLVGFYPLYSFHLADAAPHLMLGWVFLGRRWKWWIFGSSPGCQAVPVAMALVCACASLGLAPLGTDSSI